MRSASCLDLLLILHSYAIEVEALHSRCQNMSMSARTKALAKQGLGPFPSIWKEVLPSLEPLKQTPWDFNHIELKGMCERYMSCVLWCLTDAGKNRLSYGFHQMTLPFGWSRLQNPSTHSGSYGITEKGRFTIILPFVLRLFLCDNHIKAAQQSIIVDEFQPPDGSAMNVLIQLYIQLGRSLSVGLKNSLSKAEVEAYTAHHLDTRRDYLRLNKVFSTTKKGELAVQQLSSFPNLHGGVHLPIDLKRFATFKNVNTTLGEERHKVFKSAAPFTNAANVNVQLLRRMNVLQTAQSLADSAYDENPQYKWISDTILGLRLSAPRLYRQIASIPETAMLADEEIFGSGHAGRSHVKGRARLVATGYKYALDLQDPIVRRLFPETYRQGTLTGGLRYFKSGPFVDAVDSKRHTYHIGNIVEHNSEVYSILAIIGHLPPFDTGNIFLLVSKWAYLRRDPILDAQIYQKTLSQTLVDITTIATKRIHLIGCGHTIVEGGTAWRNDLDGYFH